MPSIDHVTGVFLKYDYTVAQVAVLDNASRHPETTANAVAQRIGIRTSSVNSCLVRLYTDKLIETSGEAGLRTGRTLAVTAKGVKLLRAIQRDLNDDEL